MEGFARGVSAVSPLTVSSLTAAELETLPDVKDFPVLLATQPSVTFYSENGNGFGYNYIRLRGFDERRVAVAINGLPQNDPEDHAVYWINLMDLQGAITDVQVQRGAGDGVLRLGRHRRRHQHRRRPVRGWAATASLGRGYGALRHASRSRPRPTQACSADATWRFVRASHLASDGYREHAWVRLDRLFAGVTRFGARSRVTVQAFGGPQHDALAYYGIPKERQRKPEKRRANYGAISGDVERFNQPQLELRHEWQARPDVRVESTAYLHPRRRLLRLRRHVAHRRLPAPALWHRRPRLGRSDGGAAPAAALRDAAWRRRSLSGVRAERPRGLAAARRRHAHARAAGPLHARRRPARCTARSTGGGSRRRVSAA